jgi:PhnB protein
MRFTPYLNFNGNCAEAFKFYAQVFRTEILMTMTYGDSPMADQTPPELKNRIMHVRLGEGENMLMGADAPPEHYHPSKGICVAIGIADPAEAERIFAELSPGGTIQMPIQETFWAKRFGMVTDRFGIPWMVNCEASK